jgi:hypothetical protein
MAIKALGLKRARLKDGATPTGQKVFLVGSTTKIGDDISPILDASFNGQEIPAYNDAYDASNNNVLVTDRDAVAWDLEDGTQEGFWWLVTVDYAVPETVQNALDPADRDWEWSKGPEKREVAAAFSTFDTAGYVYPNSDASNMLNLAAADAWLNTCGEPPEGGVPRIQSMQSIQLTKYTTTGSPSSIGPTSWAALDAFQDKVNEDTVVILDVTYNPFELLMDEINYANVTENGFDRVKITLRLLADKTFKHIFTFPSASYNYVVTDGTNKTLSAIKNTDGQDVSAPQLVDLNGQEIPLPESAPFKKTPVLISGGVNDLATFGTFNFPASIP